MSYIKLGLDMSQSELASLPSPASTETHIVVPHNNVIELLQKEADACSFNLENFRFGVSHKETIAGTDYWQRMFGVAEMQCDIINPEATTIIAFRNSHDKKFPLGFALGQSISVCDNLMFGGEVVIKTRHTKNVWQRIPRLMTRAVGQLQNIKVINEKRTEAYKNTKVPSDEWVSHFVVRSIDNGVLSASNLPKVLREWRQEEGSQSASHDQFNDRTLWSLNNAFTESFKIYSNLDQITSRNIKLSGMMDSYCNLDFSTEIELNDDEFEVEPVVSHIAPMPENDIDRANRETEALLEEMETA